MTPPFTYMWDDPANTFGEDVFNLSAGEYHVTVVDANGCSAIDTVNIGQPPPMNCVIIETQSPSCMGASNGILTAMASGGTPGYSYVWSTGATTSSIYNVGAGTYSVTITDYNGCTCSKTVTVVNPTNINCAITINKHVSCYGGSDGKLTASASGGTAPYSYMWSNGEITAMNSNLSAGSYTVTVTDANGCTCIQSATITEPIELECWVTINQNIDCYGANTGKLTVTAGGGTPGYSYQWSNGANTPMISNLLAGTYTVTVTDANNCICIKSMTLTNPPAVNCSVSMNSQPSCMGASDGQLTANASGGNPGYSFQWSNGAITQTISNLPAGNYTVTVTDIDGCTCVSSATLNNPPTLNCSVTLNNEVPVITEMTANSPLWSVAAHRHTLSSGVRAQLRQ